MDKKEKIAKLLLEIPFDDFIYKFFDEDSDKMLDEKIQVLIDLKNGKKPADIPNYYKILELMPKDDMTCWD